jgi:hypothetical protein
MPDPPRLGSFMHLLGATASELPKQLIVVGVRPDPEPEYHFSVPHRQRAVTEPYASRVDGPRGVHMLEPETRVLRIVAEEAVGLPCPLLYMIRKRRERESARSSGRSKRVGVQRLGAAGAVLS